MGVRRQQQQQQQTTDSGRCLAVAHASSAGQERGICCCVSAVSNHGSRPGMHKHLLQPRHAEFACSKSTILQQQ
jgi:hypothetical protein